MNKEEVTLIFPPVHDFAMPYLSLPLLKKYIEEYSDVKCNIEDFNQRFFLKIIGNGGLTGIKNEFLQNLKNSDFIKSINSAIRLEEHCLNKTQRYSRNLPGYNLSLRKVRVPYSTLDSGDIYIGMNSKDNIFYDIFIDFLSIDKFAKTKIFGISIGVEDQIFPSFTLTKAIKDSYPSAKVVIGGNIVYRLFDGIVNSMLSRYVDFLIIREGEEPLLELIQYCLKKANKKLSNPKIMSVNDAPSQQSLSEIKKEASIIDINKIKTPDFNGFNLEDYLSPIPILPTFITRKCYWAKCDFCAIHISWDPKYRIRNMFQVIEDIEHYSNKGINHFRVIDEDCPPSVLNEFANEILERGICIYFEAYTRFEKHFLNKSFCKNLARAGCRQLFFGLESIGGATLKLIGKGSFYNMENITDILRNTKATGIFNYLFMMIGIPNAPLNDEKQTISYIMNNEDIHMVSLASFVVDRGSPIHIKEAVRKKYAIEIFEIGNMTTEIGYLINKKDVRGSIKNRAENYLSEVFTRRPDLALTSLLSDDIRFILTCVHGNNFAQEYMKKLKNEEDIINITRKAIRKCKEERIERELDIGKKKAAI